MAEPRTESGRALIEAVRGAVLDPAIATLLGSDGKQELVALVSLELLETDILAIEAEAAARLGDEGLREALEAIRDYDTGEPLTAADAGALQGIAAAALTEGDSR